MQNTLVIDGYTFRPPNAVSTMLLDKSYQIKWDGMDGTTNFHKIILGKKKAKTFTYNSLNRFEFEFILNYLNNGFVPIEYNSQDFQFFGNYLIESEGYDDSFLGYKKGITLILTPQTVE